MNRFYNLCIKQFPEVSKLKEDWEILFDFLKDKVNAIIIDEFQNLIDEDDGILNIFQSIVDQQLVNSKAKLFLLGSSVSIITSKVLSYKSPLYGRRTGSIELKPVSFFDLIKFFPKKDINELVDIFGFADGIPYYLNKIEKNFWIWLKEELGMARSFIKDEVDFLLKYEFDDPSTYKLILEAIAFGKHKLNDIKNHLGVDRTDISPYLRNLIEVKMIKREVSITENMKSRHGRYYLCDNFLKFWFRYIYPNLSMVEERSLDIDVIKKDYSLYLGRLFEIIIMQTLIKYKKKIFDFNKIGKWWHKGEEIDLVALDELNKKILFCECKWSSNINVRTVLNKLEEKAKKVDWLNKQRDEYFIIFAKSFKERIKQKNLILYDIKDLERLV